MLAARYKKNVYRDPEEKQKKIHVTQSQVVGIVATHIFNLAVAAVPIANTDL